MRQEHRSLGSNASMAHILHAATQLASLAMQLLSARAALHPGGLHVATSVKQGMDATEIAQDTIGDFGYSHRIYLGWSAEGLLPGAVVELARRVCMVLFARLSTRHAPMADALRPLFLDVAAGLTIAAFRVAVRNDTAMLACACELSDSGLCTPERPELITLALARGDFLLASALLSALTGSPMCDIEADLVCCESTAASSLLVAGLPESVAELARVAVMLSQSIGRPSSEMESQEFQTLLTYDLSIAAISNPDPALDSIVFKLAGGRTAWHHDAVTDCHSMALEQPYWLSTME